MDIIDKEYLQSKERERTILKDMYYRSMIDYLESIFNEKKTNGSAYHCGHCAGVYRTMRNWLIFHFGLTPFEEYNRQCIKTMATRFDKPLEVIINLVEY